MAQRGGLVLCLIISISFYFGVPSAKGLGIETGLFVDLVFALDAAVFWHWGEGGVWCG